MGIYHNIIWERTGDSRWYIKHTDMSATSEEFECVMRSLLSLS
jgi:hypothetical protein